MAKAPKMAVGKGKTPVFGKVKAGNPTNTVAGGPGKSVKQKPFAGPGVKKGK